MPSRRRPPLAAIAAWPGDMEDLRRRTIDDFGEQWVSFTDNQAYYGSPELLREILGEALDPDTLRGARVGDIGSGTGRVVQMLLAWGAAHVTAIEPSRAFEVLQGNLASAGHRVTCLNIGGEDIPADLQLDHFVSLGVLHHVPQPGAIVRAAFKALRPGGRMTVWVYGREGNELYLALALPLRRLTVRLPHGALLALSWALYPALWLYASLCRVLPLPMRDYMTGHILRLTARNGVLTIYDQLNPAYARYYTRQEAMDLLAREGFDDLRVHHRHGYGWTVSGRKPASPAETP